MGHHVPIFKLAGGGLFLLVNNFSVGDLSSHVIFQLVFYFWNHHHHAEKKQNNGLSGFHGLDLPLIHRALTIFSFWASWAAALNISCFVHLYYIQFTITTAFITLSGPQCVLCVWANARWWIGKTKAKTRRYLFCFSCISLKICGGSRFYLIRLWHKWRLKC